MALTDERITVQVGDRTLTLSNLDKVLYPDGFTKGEVIGYYSHIAPVLLPHLAERPLTFILLRTVLRALGRFSSRTCPDMRRRGCAPRGWRATVRAGGQGRRSTTH